MDLPDISLPLLDAIEHNVAHNPSYPLFCYETESGGVEKVSWGRAGSAFNVAAWSVLNELGSGADASSPIGIIASLDSTSFYSIIVGVLKAGRVPFLISIRNTAEAIANLLSLTKCTIILSTDDVMTENLVTASVRLIEESSSFKVHRISAPTFVQLYGPDVVPTSAPIVDKKTRDQVMDTPCVLSHSSGTTSLPKPIMLTHRMINQVGFRNRLEPDSKFGRCVMSAHALPMFHMMGFTLIPWSAFLGLTLSVNRPRTPPLLPSPDVVLRGAITTRCKILYCAPTFLETWAADSTNMEALKSFDIVVYGGGPVRDDIAKLLVDNDVNLLPIMGLSETNVISSFSPRHIKAEGPAWYETDPLIDLVFVPEDEEKLKGVYRIMMKGNSIRQPACFDTNIDGLPVFDTKDLVVFHPNNPKLWKLVGRADDQITHSTGEKTNPVPIEAILEMSPFIQNALMFGRARLQPGVLISPSQDQVFDITDHKRDSISRANQSSPTHSRIFREMILVADPLKPFEYTGKGSLRRHATLNKYEKDIQQLYEATEASNSAVIEILTSLKRDAVLSFIRRIVHTILEHEVADEDDIFRVGADSLCALSIRISITRGLLTSGLVAAAITNTIPRDLVYLHPSISNLADFVSSATFLNGRVRPQTEGQCLQSSFDEDLRWQAVLQCNDTLVELASNGSAEKPPLIIIHSGNGRLTSYRPFLRYHDNVWGIQMTDITPKESIDSLAEFYYEEIKRKWPHGPYRMAAWSGSSIILMALVELAEQNGDEVVQFSMLDHFPSLFFGNVKLSEVRIADEEWIDEHVKGLLRQMATLVIPSENIRARLFSNAVAIRRNQEIIDALTGTPKTPVGELRLARTTMIQKLSLKYMMNERFLILNKDGQKVWSSNLFRKWVGGMRARLTLYVATEGANLTISEENKERRPDLGATALLGDVPFTLVTIEGDHTSILGEESLRCSLEDEYMQ
ncbi:hypothetical protein D9619_000384 [Psilocybe cf. subviscida]|uniref:AMP-dependent synthetase/ligase domain-containing protein n=1 Tax=Psilocybe cf. subviscida TaxID=2480587 RepID=A0A8H5F2E2_9AGAR|nr:hypothetical protein D9619_000384 [Psilocybe cf. subviscida]